MSLLRACEVRATVRPLFWLQLITSVRVFGRDRSRETEPPSAGLGPLPCACVRQLLRIGAPFRSKWTELPSSLLCAAAGGDATEERPLASLLERGDATGEGDAVRWVRLRAAFDATARRYRFTEEAAGVNSTSAALAFGGTLLPARARCGPDACGGLGWCTTADAAHTRGRGAVPAARGRCRCFPDTVTTRAGGCARLAYAEASPGGAADPPNTARSTTGVLLGERLVGRAADGQGSVALTEAYSGGIRFNSVRCALNCSGRGACQDHTWCTATLFTFPSVHC